MQKLSCEKKMLLLTLQTEFIEMLDGDGNIDLHPSEFMSIYKNNIAVTLLQALKSTYPLVNKLLGNDFFICMAKGYIQKYPSRSGNLSDYGEYFSEYLSNQPSLSTLDYVFEVAQFEWICNSLFAVTDHPPLDKNKLASFQKEKYDDICFVLNSAARLIQCRYPLIKIIELCQNEQADNINLEKDVSNLLILRCEFEMMLFLLTNAEFTFLTALDNNQTLSNALNLAIAMDANFKLDEKLPFWIENKTIVDCYIK